MICLGGSSAMVREGKVVHYDGEACAHSVDKGQVVERGAPKVGVTEDPVYGLVGEPWVAQGRPGEAPEDLPLAEWVGQALGAAAACWTDLEGAGAYDATRCTNVYKGLLVRIEKTMEACWTAGYNARGEEGLAADQGPDPEVDDTPRIPG